MRNEVKKDHLKKKSLKFLWKILKIGGVENLSFFELAILILKRKKNLYPYSDQSQLMGWNFDDYLPWFPAKSLGGYKMRNTVPESDFDNCKLKSAEWQCRLNKTEIQISTSGTLVLPKYIYIRKVFN